MHLPEELRYSKTHEWVRIQDDVAVIGITDFAQNELGDIVFVELPTPGRQLHHNDIFGSIESVKAVSDLISPVSGEVTEMNETVTADPAAVNSSPYDSAWLLKVKLERPEELEGLLTAAQYKDFIEDS